MTRWSRISFDKAMVHAVSADLEPQLVAEMLARGHAIKDFVTEYGLEHALALGGNPKAITEWAFDIGGACHKDTPLETFDIDGLAVSVPVDQYELIQLGIERVDRAPIRRFAGGDWYYKIKFWVHATVLTPAQRDTLLHGIEDRRAHALERARRFHEAAERARTVGIS